MANDEVALRLGDGSNDDDHGSAKRPASVDLLAKADELHFELVQLVEYFEEVLQRTGDPVRVLAKDFIPR